MVQPQLEILKNTNKVISMIQSSASFAHNVANNPMLQLAKSSNIVQLRDFGFRKEVIIMSGVYRTAQICKNGHVITSNTNNTARLSNFCPECKAETISSCPKCNTPIRGKYDVPGVISISSYTPPKYCHHCGHPFPWTENIQQSHTSFNFAPQCSQKFPSRTSTLHLGHFTFSLSYNFTSSNL